VTCDDASFRKASTSDENTRGSFVNLFEHGHSITAPEHLHDNVRPELVVIVLLVSPNDVATPGRHCIRDRRIDLLMVGSLIESHHEKHASNRAPSVYQAKRWQEFGAADLDAAIGFYVGGKRPFGAGRIVVAVASEARDTKIVDKLAAP